MSEIIKDGTGKGYAAGVDDKNRLLIVGQADSSAITASLDGRGFFITSLTVTLTSDSESCVLYLKNTSDSDLVLTNTRFQLGPSTGGSGVYKVGAIVNPTSGTMITGTDGVDFNADTPFNNNLGDQASKTFTGTVRAGVEGTTCVSVLPTVPSILGESGIFSTDSTIVFPKGSSIAAVVTPPTGNTSCEVIVEWLVYFIS